MLRQVRIENLVLAREVLLEFAPGLNLITGETGAGKSLIVGAVALALGGRGDASMVRQGEERAVVDALFDLSERPDLVQRLARAGYETADGELLVRREVGADGRSRGFVNGASVTIALMKELLAGLVEMHGQHEPQTLLQPELHRAILDRFGRLEDRLAEVRRESTAVRDIDQKLAELAERSAQRQARLELLRFRVGEFEAVRPLAGEEQRLRQERDRLRHAEALADALRSALDAIYEGEGAAVDRVHAASRRLRPQGTIDPSYTDFADRLDDVRAQLDDVAADLRAQLDEVIAEPGRLEQLEERLVAFERLRRRFDGAALEEIVSGAAEMQREIDDLVSQTESVEHLHDERRTRVAAYVDAAARLSRGRVEAAERLGVSVGKLLRSLMMPNARLEAAVRETEPGAIAGSPAGMDGVDEVEFLLAANPGEPARALRKVASGGELSRVMLALDLSLERGLPRRTLLFDEVDQGIGGEAADVLGEFLATVARRHQVICITHLPSVAARAQRHVSVTKKLKSGRTHLVVKTLDDEDDRIEEVARMLGGAMVTDTARRHAEAMIRAAKGNA